MTRHDAPESRSEADSPIAPIERAVAQALTLPFELGARVLQVAPAGIEKARQQIVLARFVGKLAVDRGTREVRQRLASEADVSSRESRGGSARSVPGVAAPAAASVATDYSAGQETLALPDYDQLPAAHVVAKLPGLSQVERDAIENYETNGRHRRTVLGKLAQLRADEASV